MNKTLLAVAIAGLSLVAGVAQASPASTTSTGTDLILSVLDNSTGNSYSLETGITQAAFLASPVLNLTINDSNWTAFAATIGATDSVVYQIESAVKTSTNANFGATTTEFIGGNYADSAAVITGLQGKLNSVTAVQGFGTKTDGYLGNIGSLATVATSSVNTGAISAWSNSSADAANVANLGAGFNGALSGNDQTYVDKGTSAELFYATYKNSLTPKAHAYDLGAFLFDINASKVGSLVFTAPTTSTVPVPGAVWMMLSGLVGMLSLNRRKKAA